MRLLICVVVPAFVVGCANPSVKPNFVLDANGAKALVIVSVTRPDREVFFTSPVCSYRSIGGSVSGTIGKSRVPRLDEDRIESTSATHLGMPSVMGKLAALELPAGEYEFFHCSVRNAFGSYSTIRPMSLRFRVAPGELVYIGNILVAPESIPFVSVSNNADRDLSLAKDRWPKVPVFESRQRLLAF
ncbi:hypothetical protein [Rhizobacter sp. Root1221]|uniref:hypothetical protein n=1 Tax=Rhizobacter sp. Root1221 TaxID=1736433 RepID=UPI0012FAA2E8|nr:hypothetical protein [Rhizobacter sp. Root1221]